jgi:hypothetical protein
MSNWLILRDFGLGITFANSIAAWATSFGVVACGLESSVKNATIWPLGRLAQQTPLLPTAVGQPMKRPAVTTCTIESFQTLNPQGESSERQISCE